MAGTKPGHDEKDAAAGAASARMRVRKRMITSLFGQNVFGRSVTGEHQHDSHGDDAERGQ